MLGSDAGWRGLAAVGAGAMIASYGLGFITRWWLLKLQVLDRPNQRSSHDVPTPRGGGVGIMLVVCAGGAWLTSGSNVAPAIVIAAALALAVVSFVDDRISIPWRVRMGVQFAAALAGVAALWTTGINLPLVSMLVGAPVFLLWIAGYANAFNFMDGINGIASVQALLAGAGTALVAKVAGLAPDHAAVVLSVLIAAAAAGFLPHNFPRARMFMGDVSSVPLGFLLAVLAVWIACERDWWLLLPLLGLHANFALDTAITLLRRWRRGDVLHQAHREHFYQRLVRAGRSHTTVTCWEAGLQVAAVAVAVAATRAAPAAKVGALAATFALWVAFFALCEREFAANERKNG